MTAATLHESWVTSDPESDLDDKFGHSLVTRAKKRKVIQPGTWAHNKFLVMGDPKLGDAYDDYTVSFDGRKYHCSCREHAHGEFRKLCSHALAVMLYRKQNRSTPTAPTSHVNGGRGDAVATGDRGSAPQVAEPDAKDSVRDGTDPAIPSPSDEMWGQPPLPNWVSEIRGHQWPAVQQAVDAFHDGQRVVILDAPTGAGKTLLAELVRRQLNAHALYVCSTKSLQAQFLKDFPYAEVLMGRANYPTADHPEQFEDTDRWGTPALTAADCTKQRMSLPACAKCDPRYEGERLHCLHCHPTSACPYGKAKHRALGAQIAVLNTSYFLTEANTAGTFSADQEEPSFDLVIVDEADLLENELMGLVEVRITKKMQADLKLVPPEKKTVESSWVEWVETEAMPVVERAMKKLPKKAADVKVIRERQKWERLLGKLKVLAAGLGDGNWVYGGYTEGEIVFRPVRVDKFGPEWLWRHGKRWLLMSATVIDPEEMAESLGLAEAKW